MRPPRVRSIASIGSSKRRIRTPCGCPTLPTSRRGPVSSMSPSSSTLLRTDAPCPRELVRRIASQRDKIRHLHGFDAIALADFGRADPRHLPGPDRMKDGDIRRCQLERIAVAGGDKRSSFAPGFGRGGGEEVVSLVPGFLGTGEAAGRDKFREDFQLLDQFVVELAAAFIGGERSLAECRGG